jgi:hypothetical protein
VLFYAERQKESIMLSNLLRIAALVAVAAPLSASPGLFNAPKGYMLIGELDTGNQGSVVVADFNGDGNADMAVADGSLDQVWIFLGNGDGTFRGPSAYSVSTPHSLAVADFNGDGKLDLVAADWLGGTVSILLGNGDGSFQAPLRFAVGSYPSSVAVGDFNGDGIPDVAVAVLYGWPIHFIGER